MAETEKVSINMSIVDLGNIDLLVQQGFYSSRTDFLVAAVRSLLQTHSPTLRQEVARRAMTVGMAIYHRDDLEKAVGKGEPLDIRVVGLLVIGDDVTAELARAAIRSVSIFGRVRASDEVKSAIMSMKATA